MKKPIVKNIDGVGTVHFRRHPRARRIKVRVRPDGQVWVSLPFRAAMRTAISFVKECGAWIEGQRRQLEHEKIRHHALIEAAGKVDRTKAAAILKDRLSVLAKRHGFTFTSVSIRNQRTRWGSCSSRDAISLNYKLIFLPVELRDYVLLHELVHTIHKNHSPRFWQALKAVCPGMMQLRQELRGIHPTLLEPAETNESREDSPSSLPTQRLLLASI